MGGRGARGTEADAVVEAAVDGPTRGIGGRGALGPDVGLAERHLRLFACAALNLRPPVVEANREIIFRVEWVLVVR
jgi:hypothetical protein